MSYTALINAIARAELAGKTFKDVASSQDDDIIANGQSYPTLKNRIDEYLNYALPTLKGDDGVDITNITFLNNDIIIDFSDGSSDIFNDVFPEDGYDVQGYYIDANDQLVETSNKGDKTISLLTIEDALEIANITVLPNANLLIEYNDGSTEEIGQIDFYAAKPFESTQIINDYLYYELSDGTVNEVLSSTGERQRVKGEQGISGNEFANVEYNRVGFDEVYLKFNMTDGSLIPNDVTSQGIGPVVTDVRIAQPEDVLRYSLDSNTGELDFYLPEVGQIGLGVIHGVDGVDGVDGTSIDTIGFINDFNNLQVSYDDGVSVSPITGNVEQFIIPEGETELLSSQILPSRDMVFKIGSPDIGEVTVNVGETRGKNGLTMDDITIDANGDILVTVNNSGSIRTQTIGNIAYNKVDDVYLNPINQIEFKMNDGTIIIADGSPNGNDGNTGPFVDVIEFDSENEMNLTLTLTDGTVFPEVGVTRPTKTHTVERVGDDIIYNFDDGSSSNLGNLNGDPARNVIDVSLQNDVVRLGFDNTDTLDSNIIASLSSIEYDNNALTFDYTEYEKNINYTRPDDGIHGKWVTEFREYSAGRLRAFYSDGTRSFLGGPSIHGNWPELFYENDGDFFVQLRTQSRPVNIGTLKMDGIDGKVPSSLSYEINGDLTVNYEDGSSDTIQDVNNTWITDLYNIGDDIVVDTNYSDTPISIGTIEGFEGSDGRWITDLRISLDRHLLVQYNDYRDNQGNINTGELIKLERVDGVDGNWITSITRNADEITFGRFLDGELIINGANAIDGIKPKYVTSATLVDGRELSLSYNDQTVDYFNDIGGADAKIPTAFTKNSNGELVVSYVFHDDEIVGMLDGLDFQDEVIDITLNDEGQLVSQKTLSTTSTDVVVRRLSDSRLEGENLILSFNNLGDIDLGDITGDNVSDGVYITNIEVVNQELFVDYSDEVAKPRESLGVFNRVDVDSATMINGSENSLENLQITLTDNSTLDLGKIKGDGDGTNIVDGLVNIDGILVLTRNDNVTLSTTERVQGDHGLDIISSDISVDGDLLFTLSDDTVVNAGFVLQDLGFAPFSVVRVYNRGESCTFDGNIYVALEDEVTSEPSPDNSQWAKVRLQDDGSFPDASKPELISPINDVVHEYEQPYLLAGELRNYYSVDTRQTRIFQIDFIENNFSNPIYEFSENLNGHQASITLTPGVNYKWRCRDIVEQTGYITDWSLEGTFTVQENIIEQPVTNIDNGYDINDVPAMPIITSSTFNGSGTHTETLWQVKRNSDDKIVYEVQNNELNTTVIPFGILFESSAYSVRSQHIGTNGNSPFSEWFSFNTASRFTINFKPVVSFLGDDINATTAKPYFKSNSFIDDFYEIYMGGEDLMVTWEVQDQLSNVVWKTSNYLDILSIQVDRVMESNQTFSIRVKYSSPRFFGETEWSDPVSFTPDWSIDTPIVTTPLDVTEYPVDGYFESTAFIGTNEEHFGSLWEVRSVADDSVKHSSYNSFTDLLDWSVSFGEADSLQEYYIVAKHLGRYGESDWSEPLFFTMQEIVNVNVYLSSTDGSVRRLNNEGRLVWVNEDRTVRTNSVAVDTLRNVYSVGNDETLRKIDEFGNEIWSYTHAVDIYNVAVDSLFNVYIGTADNLVIKLDSDANEIWRYSEHTGSISEIVVDTEFFVYSASMDDSIHKIDENGNNVWVFSGHTGNVNAMDVDVDGNVYSASADGTVRKIDFRGFQVWSVSYSNIIALSVNIYGSIFIGGIDDTVRRLDTLGVEQWATTLNGNINSIDSDYLYRSYIGLSTGDVYMLNESGEEVWLYNDGRPEVTEVRVNEIPILLKPTMLTGRYWNLVPPENLTAF